MGNFGKIVVFVVACFATYSVYAQEAGPADAQVKKIEDLEKKITVLSDEVQNVKAGYEMIPSVGEGKYGLSPAASKIYFTKKGVSLGGYGEMIYNNKARKDESGAYSGNNDSIDFVRQILYLGYKFSDKFLLNSEIEFEHGSTENGGSVSVEFAYLDYLYKDAINFRAGMLLVPMGIINELHEPTTFLSTYRPFTERTILPSTWRENGVGIFGGNNSWAYKLFLVNSFNAANFTAGKAFREGRQNGAEAKGNDFALTGRLDYQGYKGLLAGFSFFTGQTGQNQLTPVGSSINAWANIIDVHADYRIKGFQFRGLLAYAHLQDVSEINQLAGLTGANGIGEDMIGYYGEVGYDVLRFKTTEQKLVPFVRYEKVNTQLSVPSGFSSDPSNDQTIYTLGMSYSPILNIVLKANYEIHQNEGNTGVDQWNLGLGYIF